ncbi:MAG TPA: SpvB/TcaC N-terminal domain-containing protein, partial [Polyangiaceae bacterium]|nr:SpvB/TcaC N-terminal domain-containing protein [Polyangiaceae bacterium]
MPKGGGAIRGMGEKFAADPVRGSLGGTVPLAVSPGRSAFGPALAVHYDSSAGNGPFGFGWQLAVPAITRKTDTGLPRYFDRESSDTFILAGSEDLVPLLEDMGAAGWSQPVVTRSLHGRRYRVESYRPRVEGSFARIERWTNLADPSDCCWRSIARNNVTSWYGRTPESRISDPEHAERIFSFLLCESHDDKGNLIVYRYAAEDSRGVPSAAHERNRTPGSRAAHRYLKRILYANREPYLPDVNAPAPPPAPTDFCFELVFDYGDHHPSVPL